MGGNLSYDSVLPGESREIVLKYTIAKDAPSGAVPFDFRVVFANTNVFPPFWEPTGGEMLIVEGGTAVPPELRAKQIAPLATASMKSSSIVPKTAGVSNRSNWPDINYGNKCHSVKIFPKSSMVGDIRSDTGGVKIRLKMFANEAPPCSAGAQCKILDCQYFKSIIKSEVPCVSDGSKVYISPCEFINPKYPQDVTLSSPEIKDLNSKARENIVDTVDIFTSGGFALALAGLSDPSPDVRLMAVLKLDEIDGDLVAKQLCEASKDKNAGVAYYAVKALGVIDSSGTAKCLLEALKYPNPEVKREAAFWLGAHYCGGGSAAVLSKDDCGDALSLYENSDLNRSRSFKEPFEKVQQYITALQSNEDPEALTPMGFSVLQSKYNALALGGNLNTCNSRVAVKQLIVSMTDSDAAVAWGAAMDLAHFDDPRSIEPFINGLRSTDQEMRMHSSIGLMTILEHMKVYEAYSPLFKLAKDPNKRTQPYAVKALGKFKAEDSAALFAELAVKSGVDYWTNRNAIEALAEIKSEKTRNLLVGLFEKHDKRTKCDAATALRDDFYLSKLSPEKQKRVTAVAFGDDCRRGD